MLYSTALNLHAGLMLIGERRGADIASPGPRSAGPPSLLRGIRPPTVNPSTPPHFMMSADRVKPDPGVGDFEFIAAADESAVSRRAGEGNLLFGVATDVPDAALHMSDAGRESCR